MPSNRTKTRVHINFSDVDWCHFCAKNQHKNCDHHINDHAFDAMDFISVRCECPCKGRVPEDGRLIDLLATVERDHQTELDEIHAQYNVACERITELQGTISILHERLENKYDDEGNIVDGFDEQDVGDMFVDDDRFCGDCGERIEAYGQDCTVGEGLCVPDDEDD